MTFKPGNKIGNNSRFIRGVSGNPGGRPAGSVNVATVLKADALNRLADVARGVLTSEQFVEGLRVALEMLAARDPLAALRATQFLWPVAPRLDRHGGAVIANRGATDTLSDAAVKPAMIPSNLRGDETGKPETSAPAVAIPVAGQDGGAG